MPTRTPLLATTATTSGSTPGASERKNMSYTYAWFYQPLAPVKLP